MNAAVVPRHVTLVVSNPDALQYGSSPRHSFDRIGGTLGCRGANWILVDRHDRVEPVHCEICQEDGHFCIVDRSGRTHLNGAHAPLGQGVGARLSDGDSIQVGPYDIAVHLGDVIDAMSDRATSALHDEDGQPWSQLQCDDTELWAADASSPGTLESDAAFHALAAPENPRADLDPLHALELAERVTEPTSAAALDATHYGLAAASPQADLGATRFEALVGAPKILSGGSSMTNSRAESTHAQQWLDAHSPIGGDSRQLVALLMEGLGVPMDTTDAQSAHRLLLEAGQTLQATLTGLATLHRAMSGDESRLSLMGRTLQPIEDNPLRLGLNYEDSVRALFGSNRSIVHLSPSAAVQESLAQVALHQAAIVQAISVGLEALLRSFSPGTLLQRFQRYQPDPAQSASSDDWAWQMYTHYYNELASARQLGFEKLFWEVFEQAYDRAFRAEAQ
ncbi:type VI secretion system-associated FHA domain protein TagH [Dyella sp. C11]|uniref:type VI secretion system-associated FHA domain protein TagH n=1 Tax=Dyella sp. C11 TaxID=2126991 RepID=UPI000D65A9C4|nr:type VI secretion system-associated FHA domain protein TagH [Dyella sp. C11]